jgi:PPOX class probable F420-dependent enzyme
LTIEIPESFVTARRAFLATAGASGQPQVVPVCFALAEGQIYIAIDEKPKSGRPLKRLRNISGNPQVSITVDHYEEDWGALWWVMVHGRAAVLSRGADRPAALEALRERYPQYRAMDLERLPLIEVAVERVIEWRATP